MSILNSLRYRVSLALRSFNRVRYRLQGVSVGSGVFISLGAFIDTAYPHSIEIADDAYITKGAMLIAHDHSVYRLKDSSDDGRGFIKIGAGAFIGARAIVLRNVTIGENAVVSAGSVVGKDVPPNTIVMGNPARVIKEFEPRHRTKAR